MATIRKAKGLFMSLVAFILTGFLSFLGFRGPSWARNAAFSKPETKGAPSPEASPSLARAVAAAGHHAKVRATAVKKRPARASGKKVAIKKTARERTSQVSSL